MAEVSWIARCVVAAVMLLACVVPAVAMEGRVLMADGTPLADATISILGRSGVARTDRDGNFVWQPDPAPPFELLITLAGGRALDPIRVASVPADAPLILTVATAPTESIRVTADAAPNIDAPPASALTLLPREELEQRHPARLADAVENLPGVSLSGGGNDAVPVIRGMARGRTLVLIDGARVSTERRAGSSATFLDPFFLEAVEVARGPGSVAYGSDALGGVILARTRHAEPGDPFRFRATASYGAGTPERATGVELSRGLAEGGWIFQARARDVDDYRSPAGDVENSGAEDYGLLARFEHEVGHGVLSFGWQTDEGRDMERNTPTGNGSRIANPRDDSHRLTWSYRLDPLRNATLISLEGFFGSSRVVTEQDRPASATNPREVSTSDVRARDAALRFRVIRPAGAARVEGGLDLNGRFDVSADDTDPNGRESTSMEDASRADLGLYVTGDAPIGPAFVVSAGARVDRVSSRSDGDSFGTSSRVESAVSGFVSMTAGPFAGFSVTGQVARGFRDPTLSDRYFAGISGRGFVTGNPDLEPEKSWQYDLSMRYARRAFRCALLLFDYRIDDAIERFQTGQDPGTGQSLFSFRNLGEARVRGAELEAQGALGAGFRLELGLQTAKGEDGDRVPLDDIPTDRATLVLRKVLGSRGDLYARGALEWRDEDPGPAEIETPRYATLDIGAGWRFGRRLEGRLVLRNLFDREYPSSPDPDAPPAAGRSGLVTLVTSWRGYEPAPASAP